MIKIYAKNCKSENQMISRFKKKVKESKLILEIKERKFHTKKSDKKRLKKKKSLYRNKNN